MTAAEIFEQHRSLVFGIAYRMLGSVVEAEDITQDVFLRWQRQPTAPVQSAKAYLTTIVSRLCIDHLRSARHQREQYVGVWLPEPLLVADEPSPDSRAELADSLTNAFLLLLETLNPAERAVFLLREVFQYDYDEVSRIVDKSEANCRQMFSRARERLASRSPRFQAERAESEKLVQEFLAACTEGDTDGLMNLLTKDVVMYSDGGGKVAAALRPILGIDKVVRFFISVRQRLPKGVQVRFANLNAEPGVLLLIRGKAEHAMTFEINEGRIRAVYIVGNPDKLKHLSR
jgi:RNA polymerase sigma-70 factor (ECF subfamily)